MSIFNLSESAANSLYNICNIIVLMASIAGVAGAIGLFWAGGIKEKYEEIKQMKTKEMIIEANKIAALANEGQAKANKAAAEANERTKVLEQGTAKLQNETSLARLELEKVKQKQLPRTISNKDAEKVKALLKDSPNGKVIVQSDAMDAEAKRLAEQIKSILTESGFEILKVSVQVLALNDRGVFIFIKDKNAVPAHANQIRQAFDSIGFNITGRISSSGMDRFSPSDSPNTLSSDMVIIWVGQKP